MIISLKKVRLSFADIFEAKPFKAGDEPRFRATFLIEKNDPHILLIENAIQKIATEVWKEKAKVIVATIRTNPNKFCFQDGDTKTYDGYAGMMALTASSKKKPLVLDRDKTPLTQADGRPYSGCYVNASLDLFTYNNTGNGISAQLRGVQFFKDGDAFGGGTPVDVNEFENIDDFGTADPAANEFL